MFQQNVKYHQEQEEKVYQNTEDYKSQRKTKLYQAKIISQIKQNLENVFQEDMKIIEILNTNQKNILNDHIEIEQLQTLKLNDFVSRKNTLIEKVRTSKANYEQDLKNFLMKSQRDINNKNSAQQEQNHHYYHERQYFTAPFIEQQQVEDNQFKKKIRPYELRALKRKEKTTQLEIFVEKNKVLESSTKNKESQTLFQKLGHFSKKQNTIEKFKNKMTIQQIIQQIQEKNQNKIQKHMNLRLSQLQKQQKLEKLANLVNYFKQNKINQFYNNDNLQVIMKFDKFQRYCITNRNEIDTKIYEQQSNNILDKLDNRYDKRSQTLEGLKLNDKHK